MSDWSRLKHWNSEGPGPELAAVVETTRDGFLVSIRFMEDGFVQDIVAAPATGRTPDSAFSKAMDAAEKQLAEWAEADHYRPVKRRRR